MPNYTPNYNLKKPLASENYNVADQNGNMDIIDSTLKTIANQGISDGTVTDAKLGNRTVDQATATAYSNTGTLTQILSWFAKVIKGITGTTNWYDAPAATIASIWAKFNASTGHTHTGAANDGPPIPINGIASAAKTTAGGNEASRLAVTNTSGRVGDSEKLGGQTLTQLDGKYTASQDFSDIQVKMRMGVYR